MTPATAANVPAATPRPEPPPTAPALRTSLPTALAVAALLALHLALARFSLVRENPTVDEVIHLPAGISYWQTGQFKLYHHNPPLVKLLAALPVLAAGVDTAGLYESTYWTSDPPNKAGFAHEFARQNARAYFELFTRARLVMLAFTVLGGLAVFAWSRSLFGVGGGLLSLTLWCLCPNILAHARLITTDVPAAALAVGSTFLFWRYLERPIWPRAAVAGVALGLAELTKFSLILLYVLWPVLGLARLGNVHNRRRLGPQVLHGALILLLSVLVINLGYGFEGCGTPLGKFTFYSRTLTRDREPVPPGPQSQDLFFEVRLLRVNRFKDSLLGTLPVPLPREFVLGFDDQKFEAEGAPLRAFNRDAPAAAVAGYPVYLDGEHSDRSWWYYYLRCLQYKLPEGTLLLLGLALAVAGFARGPQAAWCDDFALLALPVVMLVAMSGFTNIAIGMRYVLPILPFLFILAGRLVPWARSLAGSRRGLAFGAIALGLGLTTAAALTGFRHPIAYFNWISGGPQHGSEHLIDSNLDWGQDLVGLHRWLREHAPDERVGIAYFGQIPPAIFAARGEPIDWFLPPARPGCWGENRPWRYRLQGDHTPPPPGLYAVSASLVRGLPWRVYDSVASRPELVWAPSQAQRGAFDYFAKLMPFDHIGHSILLYRITPEQAARLAALWQAP